MQFDPPLPANTYHDSFGNFCHVINAPAGRLTVSTDFLVQDNGEPDAVAPQAEQHALGNLPVEVLIYLLGSRYCDIDRLADTAWSLFGTPPGGPLRAGDLRLRPRSDHVRLPACAPDPDRFRSTHREAWRVPRTSRISRLRCAVA